MPQMLFYGYFRSSAAYRCRIAFNLKGVFPDFVPVHLRKGEQRHADFLARNAQGLLPALETEGRILTQSLAILEWLDETVPLPPLLPRLPLERAYIRSLAQMIACDTHPLQNLRILNYLKTEMQQDQAAIECWCRHWIGDGLAAYEATLARNGNSGLFSFGNTPTLADVCLVPQLFNADRFGVPLDALPNIRRIRMQCEALDAFATAHPSRQPDAE